MASVHNGKSRLYNGSVCRKMEQCKGGLKCCGMKLAPPKKQKVISRRTYRRIMTQKFAKMTEVDWLD